MNKSDKIVDSKARQTEVNTPKPLIRNQKPSIPWELNVAEFEKSYLSDGSLKNFNKLFVKHYKSFRKIKLYDLDKDVIDNNKRKRRRYFRNLCVLAKNMKYSSALSVNSLFAQNDKDILGLKLEMIKKFSNVICLQMPASSFDRYHIRVLYYLKRLRNFRVFEDKKSSYLYSQQPLSSSLFSTDYKYFLKKIKNFRFHTVDFCDTKTPHKLYSDELQKLCTRFQLSKTSRICVLIAPNKFVAFKCQHKKFKGGSEKISLYTPRFKFSWTIVQESSTNLIYSSFFREVFKINETYESDLMVHHHTFLRYNLERVTLLGIMKLTSSLKAQNLKIRLRKEFQKGQPLVFLEIWETLSRFGPLKSLNITLPIISKNSVSNFAKTIFEMKLSKLQIFVEEEEEKTNKNEDVYKRINVEVANENSKKGCLEDLQVLFRQIDRSQELILSWLSRKVVMKAKKHAFEVILSYRQVKKENETEVSILPIWRVLMDKNVRNSIIDILKTNGNLEISAECKLDEKEKILFLEKLREVFLSKRLILHDSQFRGTFTAIRHGDYLLITLDRKSELHIHFEL